MLMTLKVLQEKNAASGTIMQTVSFFSSRFLENQLKAKKLNFRFELIVFILKPSPICRLHCREQKNNGNTRGLCQQPAAARRKRRRRRWSRQQRTRLSSLRKCVGDRRRSAAAATSGGLLLLLRLLLLHVIAGGGGGGGAAGYTRLFDGQRISPLACQLRRDGEVAHRHWRTVGQDSRCWNDRRRR